VKAPKINKPSYATYSQEIMHVPTPYPKQHFKAYTNLVQSWALVEHVVSCSIAELLQIQYDAAHILLGVTDFRSKYNKLVQLSKHFGIPEPKIKRFREIRDSVESIRHIRNLISHIPLVGFDKNDEDVFYLKPLHGYDDGSGKFEAYKLHYSEIRLGAGYLNLVAQEVGPDFQREVIASRKEQPLK